jgi:enamine deaminase RidA (YjgF/YER057c/UK114 family)
MKNSIIHFFTVAVAIILVSQGFQPIALGQNLTGVAIAYQPTSTVKREYINPKTLYSGVDYGFSQAVATQGKKTIYLSGQVAWDIDQKTVGVGNLAIQTRKALENMRLALAAAGATPKDVVQIEAFVANYQPKDAEIVGGIVRDFFPLEALPTSTLIGVQSLAFPDLLIEVKAIAVVDE